MVPFYELQPSDINVIRNKRELNFRPHLHKYIELVYIFKGGQHMRIDGGEYVLGQGDAAVIFPNQEHSYSRPSPSETEEVILICTPRVFGDMFPDFAHCRARSPIIRSENVSPDARLAFSRLDEANGAAANLGWALIIISETLKCMDIKKTREGLPEESVVPRVIEFVDENYTKPINADAIAKELHISKNYVYHIFSDFLKINMRNYIGSLRAEYAARLLRTTELSMSEISGAAGFESQRTFNRVFKSVYNMTPREYKSNISAYIASSGE